MSKPIIIDQTALAKIKDQALRVFHDTHHLPDDSKDAQVFMILQGFAVYLASQGIEPQFKVKPVKEDYDSTPLDDL